MGLDAHESDKGTSAVHTADKSHTLDGIWNRPSTDATPTSPADATPIPTALDAKKTNTSSITNEQSAPVFTDSDGTPLTDAKLNDLKYNTTSADAPVLQLASMTLPRFPAVERQDVTQVSDKRSSERQNPTVGDLSRAAHKAIGSGAYGNKVPSSAAEFAGESVPQNVKCASTSSQWLVEAGMMTNRDFKIRVSDMIKMLPGKGFSQVPLSGNLDLSKFPDGPIGFITGRGNYDDGSNHIGFIEKRDGQLRVIHNDYHTGKVVDQDIKQKFYTADGKPAYRDMSMFVYRKR